MATPSRSHNLEGTTTDQVFIRMLLIRLSSLSIKHCTGFRAAFATVIGERFIRRYEAVS